MRKTFKNLVILILPILIGLPILRFNPHSAWQTQMLSGAANFEWRTPLKVNPKQVKAFHKLDLWEQLNYKFVKSDKAIEQPHIETGYLYFILLSKTLFFPFGDRLAVSLFQLLAHSILCFLVLRKLNWGSRRFWLFLLLYTVNPLFLRVVLINFYYFWVCVPGFFIVYYFLYPQQRKLIFGLSAFVIPFVVTARPTVIPMAAAFFFLPLLITSEKRLKWQYWLSGILIAVLVFGVIHHPAKRNIYHTIYVGIGAYVNPHVEHMNDHSGYNFYHRKTNTQKRINGSSSFYDQDLLADYQRVISEEVKRIFAEDKAIFVKNAILNTLQLFSVGHISNYNHPEQKPIDYFNYFTAGVGLVFLSLLLYFREYVLVALILLPSGFVLFHPPVQIYMFGSFLFSVIAFIRLTEHIIRPKRREKQSSHRMIWFP